MKTIGLAHGSHGGVDCNVSVMNNNQKSPRTLHTADCIIWVAAAPISGNKRHTQRSLLGLWDLNWGRLTKDNLNLEYYWNLDGLAAILCQLIGDARKKP